MAGTAVAVGGGLAALGGVGSFFGGKEQADASARAAELQFLAAREGLEEQRVARREGFDFARQSRDEAVGLAQASPRELAEIDKQLQIRDQALKRGLANIERQEKLLEAIDPALLESGKQALELLQGKEAAALQPIRRQRQREKASLVQNLQDRLGSGFETTEAGRRALQNFDLQTDQLLSNTQQQTLGSLLATATGARPNLTNDLATTFGTVGNLSSSAFQGTQSLRNRVVNAFTGNPVNAPAAPDFGNVIASAGASQIGAIGQAKAFQDLFGGFGQFGGQILGLGLTGSLFPNAFAGGGTA